MSFSPVKGTKRIVTAMVALSLLLGTAAFAQVKPGDFITPENAAKVKDLVSTRRALNRRTRDDTFEFLEKKGVKYIASETNFFMFDAQRPHGEFASAMAENKVIVGRVWPSWPNMVRVTVGSPDDMAKFKAAFEKVWG